MLKKKRKRPKKLAIYNISPQIIFQNTATLKKKKPLSSQFKVKMITNSTKFKSQKKPNKLKLKANTNSTTTKINQIILKSI